MPGAAMEIGESFVGAGNEAAHLNVVLGPRDGPVGAAWATALATPSQGHTPFMAVVRPGLPAKPPTLFISKAAIESEGHGTITWGAAQAGVAAGVADAMVELGLDDEQADELVLIAAVWVNPEARDADLVYRNNRAATFQAVLAASAGRPALDDVLAARHRPENPYFTAPD